jgi:hypothetical protein
VELTDFLQESLQDASLLNRYVADTSSCLIYQKVNSLLLWPTKYFDLVFFKQAFHGNSLLSRLPPGNIKKLSQLGYLKVAFDLKKHPAFTGTISLVQIAFIKFKFYLLMPRHCSSMDKV